MAAGMAEVAPVAMTAAENDTVLPFTSTLFGPVKTALPCGKHSHADNEASPIRLRTPESCPSRLCHLHNDQVQWVLT